MGEIPMPRQTRYDVDGDQPKRAVDEAVRFAFADQKDNLRDNTDYGYSMRETTTPQVEAVRSIPQRVKRTLGSLVTRAKGETTR